MLLIWILFLNYYIQTLISNLRTLKIKGINWIEKSLAHFPSQCRVDDIMMAGVFSNKTFLPRQHSRGDSTMLLIKGLLSVTAILQRGEGGVPSEGGGGGLGGGGSLRGRGGGRISSKKGGLGGGVFPQRGGGAVFPQRKGDWGGGVPSEGGGGRVPSKKGRLGGRCSLRGRGEGAVFGGVGGKVERNKSKLDNLRDQKLTKIVAFCPK